MPLVPACFASPAIGNFLQGEDNKTKLLYLFKKTDTGVFVLLPLGAVANGRRSV